MKKILLLLSVCLCLTTFVFSEERLSMKKMLERIEGKWELDNNKNITFTKVIEAEGRKADDLYSKILAFFTYTYNSGESVIQVEDKEKGLIIGKGVYPKVHVGISFVTTTVNTTHIIRADIKDNKVRIIVTLQEYDIRVNSSGATSYEKHQVSSRFPIAKKDIQKTVMGKAFYKSYLRAMSSFDKIEKAIKEGMTGTHEDDNW